MTFATLQPPCATVYELRWGVTPLLVTGLLLLFLGLLLSGCASVQPTPMVTLSCKNKLDALVLPTPEPDNALDLNLDLANKVADLQGALQSCNIDKKSIRDTVKQLDKGETK